MGKRRAWICVFLFTLQAINYADRVALSVVAKPVASDLALSPVAVGVTDLQIVIPSVASGQHWLGLTSGDSRIYLIPVWVEN